MKFAITFFAVMFLGALAACSKAAAPQDVATEPEGPSIRCAVIGGMFDTGFWTALEAHYKQETGIHVKMLAAGPKDQLDKAFKNGGIDLITMHASDTIINLVADGYADDPQPFMRNDLIIVGPADDPAGIKGMSDAAEALKKISATKSFFVVHASLGAQEVLRDIMERNNITIDPANMLQLFDDNQRQVLKIAADKHAYTLVGRIPFRDGKLPNNGLVLMVRGDERLRRPYVVAVADPNKIAGANVVEAKRFAAYLRSPETQKWISEFGRGSLDDGPIFFPVVVPATAPSTRPQ